MIDPHNIIDYNRTDEQLQEMFLNQMAAASGGKKK